MCGCRISVNVSENQFDLQTSVYVETGEIDFNSGQII